MSQSPETLLCTEIPPSDTVWNFRAERKFHGNQGLGRGRAGAALSGRPGAEHDVAAGRSRRTAGNAGRPPRGKS
jgi:hypothetical protein